VKFHANVWESGSKSFGGIIYSSAHYRCRYSSEESLKCVAPWNNVLIIHQKPKFTTRETEAHSMTEPFYKAPAVVSPLNQALAYINKILFNSKPRVQYHEHWDMILNYNAICLFRVRLIFDPEDGSDTFLRNVGSDMDYTALYLMRWQNYYYCNASWSGHPVFQSRTIERL
jgi:hypothetical protein